jgi:hypothetical protein
VKVNKVSEYAAFLFLLFTVIVNLYTRIRLINIPFNRDEATWAYAAQSMFHGVPLYSTILDTKLPGTVFIYWIFFFLFGSEIWAVRLSAVIAVAVTAYYIFLLASKLFSRISGLISAAVYLTLSLSMTVEGMFAYTEHYAMLFIMIALYHSFKAKEGSLFFNGAVSGFCISLAFMSKQQVLPIALLPAAVFFMAAGRGKILKCVPVFIASFLAPFAGLMIYLVVNNMVPNFIESIGKNGVIYFLLTDIKDGIVSFSLFLKFVRPWDLLFPAFAVVSYAVIAVKKEKTPGDILLLFFLPVAFIAISAGFMYRTHYFIFLLPPVAMLCGQWTSLPWKQTKDIAVYFMAAAAIYAVYAERTALFSMGYEKYLKKYYGTNPFFESLKISEYIRARTAPGDKITVLGAEPEIYFYSMRQDVSNDAGAYLMMWAGKNSKQMEERYISAIEKEKPVYLVFVNIDLAWRIWPDSDMLIFNWYEKMRRDQFTKEGIADMISPDETVYVFGDEAKDYKPKSGCRVEIYRTNFMAETARRAWLH